MSSAKEPVITKNIPRSVQDWLALVQTEQTIEPAVKNGQNLMHVAQTTYESGSNIRQGEFLHLRAFWDIRPGTDIIDYFYRNNNTNEYKGYVSPANDAKAAELFQSMSRFWKRYLLAVEKNPGLVTDLECGGWDTVRFLQEMSCHHTKNEFFPGNVFKEGYHPPPSSDDDDDDDDDGQGSAGAGLPARFRNLSLNAAPPEGTTQGPYGTPFVQPFHMAAKSEYNRPSIDEMYPNTALVQMLEEVRKEISAEMPLFNWVLPRLGLHLRASRPERRRNMTTFLKRDKAELMQAQVDGYLCRRIGSRFSDTPLAICEAKPFVRSEHAERTLRQETAEMACWIAQHGGSQEGLLQASASGRFRRLMVSHNRHEMYIIIGEYGAKYQQYIEGEISLSGMAPIERSPDFDAEANKRNAEGSGSYNEQVNTLPEGRGQPVQWQPPPPPPPAKAPINEAPRSRKPVRGVAEPLPPPSRRVTRSQTPTSRRLPPADEFLVMHQFGPFLTGNAGHMGHLVRRLIGFMLQLRDSVPAEGPAAPSASAKELLSSSIPLK